MLGKLQIVFHLDIVQFAYSVTLNKKTERLVLLSAGFQAVSHHLYQTKVIKMSINHPDVSICVQLTVRKKVDLQEYLYFLLNECIDNDGIFTPEKILKTIVFVDGRLSVRAAAIYLQNILFQKCKAYTTKNRASNDVFYISNMIQEFTAII